MAVPTLFSNLSTTPGTNVAYISGSDSPIVLDDHLRTVYAFIASVYANSGNGWASPYLTAANPSYTGTLTGGTGIVDLGSGQFYKDAAGNFGLGTTAPTRKLTISGAGVFSAALAPAIRLDNTTSGRSAIIDFDNSDFLNIWASDAGAGGIKLFTGAGAGTERLRIASPGNVTITAPSSGIALTVSGALALSNLTSVATGAYTLLAADSTLRIQATCTLALPAAASFPGRRLRVMNVGAIALTSASADVVPQGGSAGGTAILAATSGKWADLESNGTGWFITASN